MAACSCPLRRNSCPAVADEHRVVVHSRIGRRSTALGTLRGCRPSVGRRRTDAPRTERASRTCAPLCSHLAVACPESAAHAYQRLFRCHMVSAKRSREAAGRPSPCPQRSNHGPLGSNGISSWRSVQRRAPKPTWWVNVHAFSRAALSSRHFRQDEKPPSEASQPARSSPPIAGRSLGPVFKLRQPHAAAHADRCGPARFNGRSARR